MFTTHKARVALFSVMSVCVSVCVDMITAELLIDIITKFSGHHPMVERAKFEKWLYRGTRVVIKYIWCSSLFCSSHRN